MMQLFRHILANELRLLARSPRSLALYLIYAAALTAATIGGIASMHGKVRAVAGARQDDADRWAILERVMTGHVRKGDPAIGPMYGVHNAYQVGAWLGQRHAVKEPTTFAGIATGQGDLFPSAVEVSVLDSAVDNAVVTVSNPNHRFVGGFDLAFVITFLLPIVIIGLNFDALSQERESKRIAFYNAIPGAPATLLLGRLATRCGITLALTLIAAVAAPALLFHQPGWLPDALLWTSAITIWTMIWTCLVGLFAIPAVAPGIAFLMGLAAWLVFVVVGPAFINHRIAEAMPPPDRLRFAFDVRDLKGTLLKDPAALFEEYYRAHPEDRPSADRVAAVAKPLAGGAASNDSRRFLVSSLPIEERIAPRRRAIQDRIIAEERYARSLGRWVPGLAFHMFAEEVADTSRPAIADFHRQAVGFQERWRSVFVPRVMRIEPFGEKDLADVPRFVFRQQNDVERRARFMELLMPSLVFMLTLCLLLIWTRRRLI